MTKIFIPLTCRATVLSQGVLASCIHLIFALPWGIRAQLPPQQTSLVVISAAKKAVTTAGRSALCTSGLLTQLTPKHGTTASGQRRPLASDPRGPWVAVSISALTFAPQNCPNKSPKLYHYLEKFLPLQALSLYQSDRLIYTELLVFLHIYLCLSSAFSFSFSSLSPAVWVNLNEALVSDILFYIIFELYWDEGRGDEAEQWTSEVSMGIPRPGFTHPSQSSQSGDGLWCMRHGRVTFPQKETLLNSYIFLFRYFLFSCGFGWDNPSLLFFLKKLNNYQI